MSERLKRVGRVNIGKKKVLIYFDDGDTLEMLPNTYVEYPLYVGKEVDETLILEIKRRNKKDKVFTSALKTISSSSVSQKRFIERMKNLGYKEKESIEALKHFISSSLYDEYSNFLDNLHLLEDKLYGHKRIAMELTNKGFPIKMINEIKIDKSKEVNKAKEHLKKLNDRLYKENLKTKKRKIYQALLRLGFLESTINEVIGQIKENDPKFIQKELKKECLVILNRYKRKEEEEKTLRVKVINYLMNKGYKYNEIKKTMEEIKNGED